MFDFIRGRLAVKQPTRVVVDVNGVGYELRVSLTTAQQLPQEGAEVELKTYLHVREDLLQLFGFYTVEERELFLALVGVSGVGPKLAQTILSGLPPEQLVAAIQNSDERQLHRIVGVGKKTAQRLIVELKDKTKKMAGIISQPATSEAEPKTAFSTLEEEALMALLSLGYTRQQAERAILRVQKQQPEEPTIEALIKQALQAM